MLDDGLNFVESMGFLLTDQDIHLLETEDQQMLWESLPLKAGVSEAEAEEVPAPTEEAADVKKQEKVAVKQAKVERKKPPVETVADVSAPEVKAPVAEARIDSKDSDSVEEAAENVDDLLAAVEAMRAKRPGLRARKAMPSPEEMDRRKQELRENIGRILASQ